MRTIVMSSNHAADCVRLITNSVPKGKIPMFDNQRSGVGWVVLRFIPQKSSGLVEAKSRFCAEKRD